MIPRSRALRVLVIAMVAGVAGVVIAISGTSSTRANSSAGGNRAELNRCALALLGFGGSSARAVSGSSAPQLLARFAVFRGARSRAGTLPASAHLGRALASAGATTYDPSALVRLTGNAGQQGVYAVPATLAPATLPSGCNKLPQFAGVDAWFAAHAQDTGSGAGACVIVTQVVESVRRSGLPLPGQRVTKPRKTLVIAHRECQSETVLLGYAGTLGTSGTSHALFPDGINAVTYTLSNGRAFTVPVLRNVATPPQAVSVRTTSPRLAELRQQLAAHLPATVIETGTGGHPTMTLNRPASFIPNLIASSQFLRHLLSGTLVSTSSSGASTTASCSARTHRCVAVTIVTTCNAHEHCQMTRRIKRYRYVGAKPPAGTTGPNNQPTAPIVARINKLINRPRKLSLLLTGTPERRVEVLLSVNCFRGNSGADIGGGPGLHVRVPSRTPIPVMPRAFHACDVTGLVTSTQRGQVRATVVRG